MVEGTRTLTRNLHQKCTIFGQLLDAIVLPIRHEDVVIRINVDAPRHVELDRSSPEFGTAPQVLPIFREDLDTVVTAIDNIQIVVFIKRQTSRPIELSLAEIRKRGEELARELAGLEKQPVVKNVLRYQTPVARTVQSDELHFEVRAGRVTFLDVEALVREIRQGLKAKGEVLKTSWQVQDETAPVGAFRLRYVIGRERGLIESVTGAGRPTVSRFALAGGSVYYGKTAV